MTHIYILLNHSLTERQVDELHQSYGNDAQLVYPPETIKIFWSQIPVTSSLPKEPMQEIVKWLSSACANDVLLVQGDYGATFMLVDYALKNGLIALYAVTQRVAQEQKNGEQVMRQYVFEHECFRKYMWFCSKENL